MMSADPVPPPFVGVVDVELPEQIAANVIGAKLGLGFTVTVIVN